GIRSGSWLRMPSTSSRRSWPTADATTPAAISSAARRCCPSQNHEQLIRQRIVSSESPYSQGRDDGSLLRGRIGPGAGLLVGAAERVPLLERIPDLLGRRLGLRAQLGEIDARNDGAFHHHLAVDDDGVDVVADAALHDALDGIAHRSVAQRVATR